MAEAGFQAGGGSEGWVVYVPVDPRILFRHEAVGWRWLRGRQTQIQLQNNLAVGGWGLRDGYPDPFCGDNRGLFWGPLMTHRGILLLLPAVATEVLSQATDAQDGHDDQEDDDKDPQGAREEFNLLAAVVTTAFESFGAGGEGTTIGCSLLEAGQQAEQQGGNEA